MTSISEYEKEEEKKISVRAQIARVTALITLAEDPACFGSVDCFDLRTTGCARH